MNDDYSLIVWIFA